MSLYVEKSVHWVIFKEMTLLLQRNNGTYTCITIYVHIYINTYTHIKKWQMSQKSPSIFSFSKNPSPN